MRDEEIFHVTQRDDMLIRLRKFRALNYSTFLSESRLTTQGSCTTCRFLKTQKSEMERAGSIPIGIIQILIFCWPCISIYLFLNIKQLDALNFIISLFQASTCFEHMCSSSGGQNCFIQSLVSSRAQSSPNLCAGWPPVCVMIPETVQYNFCPPDEEHMRSKHVEAWNKLIIKFSASSWLILRNKKKGII